MSDTTGPAARRENGFKEDVILTLQDYYIFLYHYFAPSIEIKSSALRYLTTYIFVYDFAILK